jgi:hypothetical protein
MYKLSIAGKGSHTRVSISTLHVRTVKSLPQDNRTGLSAQGAVEAGFVRIAQ